MGSSMFKCTPCKRLCLYRRLRGGAAIRKVPQPQGPSR
ncbi:hypothetical protein [Pseudomonas sp. FEN]|nr:hypothetical protein [Pseudomonas sp. FEN]